MRLTALALLTLFAFASAPTFAQPLDQAVQSEPPTLFVITYRAGPRWIAGRPAHEQDLGEHAAYVGQLLADGKVFAGGPFTDSEGGMAILWASDRAEAEAILAADPAQRDGIMIGEIKDWAPYFDSRQPLRRLD